MNRDMKNFFKKVALAFASFGIFSIGSIVPAFAQSTTPINICPGGEFSGVCGTSVNSLIGNVIQAVFVIAILVALFFLIWGGINWIISQGNKEKVSAARNTLIAALVGLIVIFLSYFLLNLVIQLLFGDSVQNVLSKVTSKGVFDNNGGAAAPAGGDVCSPNPCVAGSCKADPVATSKYDCCTTNGGCQAQ